MNTEELVRLIEARFRIGKPTNTALSVTGEPYVTIGSQEPSSGMPAIPGTIDEGKPHELAFDQETACISAFICFENYAAWWREQHGDEAQSVLYWRIKPQLEWEHEWTVPREHPFPDDRKRCKVYMRCLLSNKPILAKRVGIQDHGYVRIGAVRREMES